MKNFLAGILFCVLALSGFAQNSYVDSLKMELQSAHDTSALRICWNIAEYYSSFDNSLFDNYLDTLLLFSKKYSSEYWEALAYNNRGLIRYRLGDYSSAVNYYAKAEALAKNISNQELLYKVYNDLGMIYCEMHDFKNSHKYYDMAIDNVKRLNDDDAYAITLVNVANLYYDTEEYDKIFALYDSALNITGDADTRIAILNNKACLQYFIGDIEDAKNTYDKLLLMLDTKVDVYIYTSVLNSMSSIYIREGEYDKAIQYLHDVDSICRANNFDDILMKLYCTYYELYIKIGDFEQAHDYMECYNLMRDSIYSIEVAEELNELENRNLQEKNELEILHQKSLNKMLFVVIFLVLAFSAIVAFLLVRKSHMNKMLGKLNSDLKQRDNEITSNLDYAREIQLGCMSNGLMKSNLQMFVLDRPKVVVGGDFYISQAKGDASYVVVGDCTGHGISGGFLSVLGIKSVYAAIEKYNALPEMASFVNKEFCEIVSSADNLKGESLCMSVLRICGNEVRFLGSKQRMWLVSDGEAHEYKSSNAIMGSADIVEFTEEIINVKSGDVVFLSTDGYPDQFGANGKLKYSRFRNMLLECAQMAPDKAKEFLSTKLDLWRGDMEQTDDVMVVGIYF